MDLSRRVNTDPRRALPSIHRLSEALVAENPELPRWAAAQAAQEVVTAARDAMDRGSDPVRGGSDAPAGEGDWLVQARARAVELARPRPSRVINATGVVLPTNLGRARMSPGPGAAAPGTKTHPPPPRGRGTARAGKRRL